MAPNQFILRLLLVLVGCFSLCFLRRKSVKKPYNGPAVYPIVGSAIEFFRNHHRILQWFTETMDKMPMNTFKLKRPGGIKDIMTGNPANVEHILKTRFEDYPKGERFTTLLQDFLWRRIFNVDGEPWKMQRKTASHEFNTKSLRNFVMDTVQWEIQNRLLPVLSTAAKTGKSIDLQDILQRFAFDNICRVAFGVDPACLLPSMPTSPVMHIYQLHVLRESSIIPRMDKCEDIVVVGGGVAGLATTLSLHRVGLKSLVLERADCLQTAGVAFIMWPNAWKALDALGVSDSLRPFFSELDGYFSLTECIFSFNLRSNAETHFQVMGVQDSGLFSLYWCLQECSPEKYRQRARKSMIN